MTSDHEKGYCLPHNPEMEPTAAIAAEYRQARQAPGWWNAETGTVMRPAIHLIEDDQLEREVTRYWFEREGWDVLDYASAEEFLTAPRPSREACLIVDVKLPGMSGVELLEVLSTEKAHVPAIMVTGCGDIAAAVSALKAGASDFLEKPADCEMVVESVMRAIEHARAVWARDDLRTQAAAQLSSLTPREREVMKRVLEGTPNKNIAADLGISQRTVESHRAGVMQKTGSRSLPALVELYLLASGHAGATGTNLRELTP